MRENEAGEPTNPLRSASMCVLRFSVCSYVWVFVCCVGVCVCSECAGVGAGRTREKERGKLER